MAGILDRKVALVTGRASGIGRATARDGARGGGRPYRENAAGTVA
jgi:NAD(P)-dependent dehydrogenase (short-subunit alcohol dehydrogenase family)